MKTIEEREQLQIKSYFAGSVEAALDLARRELGPEALLINSRQAPQEARHLGDYEVVFAVKAGANQSPEPAEPRPAAAGRAPLNELLHRELTELRKQMEEVRESMMRAEFTSRMLPPSSELAKVFSSLVASGVEVALAQEIAESLHARLATPSVSEFGRSRFPQRQLPSIDPDKLRQYLVAELENRFAVDPALGVEGEKNKVVALVGPPGAGKTTTLVKLAVTCGLTARKPVQLLSTDTYRIAAAEQLRSYAAILGVGIQVVETAHALAQAIEEHRSKDLILIDTPGYSAATLEDAAGLAAYFSSHPEIDTHLVLPASMKPSDLARTVDQFEIFRPAKLLFTKLDETDSFGSVFCEAVRSGKPISFMAGGQLIPEDLEPAAKAWLIDGILRERAERALSAA